MEDPDRFSRYYADQGYDNQPSQPPQPLTESSVKVRILQVVLAGLAYPFMAYGIYFGFAYFLRQLGDALWIIGLITGPVIPLLITICAFVGPFIVIGITLSRLSFKGAWLLVGLGSAITIPLILHSSTSTPGSTLITIGSVLAYLLSYGFIERRKMGVWLRLGIIVLPAIGLIAANNIAPKILDMEKREASLATQQKEEEARKLEQTNINKALSFDIYIPTYTPDTITMSQPELSHSGDFTNSYVGVNLTQKKPQESYERGAFIVIARDDAKYKSVLHSPDYCDINEIYFDALDSGAPELYFTNKDPLSIDKGPCADSITTPKGRQLYHQFYSYSYTVPKYGEAHRSEDYFYVKISSTIVVLRFGNDTKSIAYTKDFLPEIIKIVDSLELTPKEKVKQD